MKFFLLLVCSFISQLQAEQQTPQQLRLAMGFYYPTLSNMSNQTDIQLSLNYWIKELTNKINLVNSYSILYDDIIEMNEAFSNHELDMVVAPPLLLSIYFDRELLRNGFVGVLQKNKKDHLAIIANIKSVSLPINFRGKRLLLPSNELLAQILLDTEIIKQYKQSFRHVFSQIQKKDKNEIIILDLFFDKADIAVVYESVLNVMIEMNPQVAKRIVVLKRFPVLARNYSFFHRDYYFQNKLKELARQFGSEPRGKQILEVFKMSHIEKSDVRDLDRFDTLYQTYLNLNTPHKND